MAATRPMAQQNKKHGNLAQECFTEGMVDHEMHLKMSKKIAQLTKVRKNKLVLKVVPCQYILGLLVYI